jgi:hypothetical protein
LKASPYEKPAVAMLDSSLRLLGPGMSLAVLRPLFTIRGGEPLKQADSGDWELLEDGRQRSRREPWDLSTDGFLPKV